MDLKLFFLEGPTKTWSNGLTIRWRTPQVMFSMDGRKSDPAQLFKLLSKQPERMKSTRPIYVSIINRLKSADVWYTKVRMEQTTIGNKIKSMGSCLKKNKKLTNHSIRKIFVSKLRKSCQLRNVICEITGHTLEFSLGHCKEIGKSQRKELSHHQWIQRSVKWKLKKVSNQNTTNQASDQEIAVQHQPTSLVPIYHIQQQG